MAKLVPLADAVAELVHDGDTVALEGFTHLIPFAAGHEIIRQGRRDLTLVRMTPDVIYDQLIGAGCARRLVFSWGGNPGVGSLHRFRDAVQHGWPGPLELEEHSHAGMANRYVAGASGLPFAVLRGYAGTDLPRHTANIAAGHLPVHRRDADRRAGAAPRRHGDARPARRPGRQRADVGHHRGAEGGRARRAPVAWSRSRRSWTELTPRARRGRAARPGRSPPSPRCPRGAHPSYAQGYYDRDNDFYRAWDAISRDRDTFPAWLDEHVLRRAGERRR